VIYSRRGSLLRSCGAVRVALEILPRFLWGPVEPAEPLVAQLIPGLHGWCDVAGVRDVAGCPST